MPLRRLASLPLVFAVLTASSAARAQAAQSAGPALGQMAGCTLQGKTYLCSKPDLVHALGLSSSIKAVSSPPNHASDQALAELLRQLGKSPAGPDAHPDLIFALEPVQMGGVSVGMSTADLAHLRVLIANPDGSEGKLLWVETYNGDPSMIWPTVVRALVQQFRDRLKSR